MQIIVEKIIRFKYLKLFLIIAIYLNLKILFNEDKKFHIYFLDVGQGDSILIKTPNHRYILIDTGKDEKIIEKLDDIIPFWNRLIDIIIITHDDEDHIGGIDYIVDKYNVNYILSNKEYKSIKKAAKIQEEIDSNSINYYLINNNVNIKTDELILDVLWPELNSNYEGENSDNENSIVIMAKYRDKSFLLTADINKEQEENIIKQDSYDGAEILKISHHGSKNATSDVLLDNVSFKYAVISCGVNNMYNLPSEEVLDRLTKQNIETLRTDIYGNIEFIYEDGELVKKLEKNN
jgi:competence protein ComEC